jgi:hypothetical protein
VVSYFLCYFSSTSTEQISPDSAGPFTSFDPVGFAIFATHARGARVRRIFTEVGGLLSYGIDQLDSYRHAATYADRILKGAKPSELPVQAPVKFELAINLKTAKALGLDVPLFLQQRADYVIE